MLNLISSLYPICRSITGNGARDTLRIISQYIPLQIREVPSGTKVFDWTVPKEWNIKDAFIKNRKGQKVVDFRKSNLHVMGYSSPVRAKLALADLAPHLFTLPDHPDWIPYRTSYYKDDWGFCLSHSQLAALEDEEYEVVIDSTLEDGHLSFGEYFIPGNRRDEIVVSCHVCHPSLCNDNLSGVAVSVMLARAIQKKPNYSYRFLFIPGTIGSITWLALNQANTANIKHGLVITGVGDKGPFTYKRSRRGNAAIDRAFDHILGRAKDGSRVIDFHPYGYDERQFCSPGFNLPFGCAMRTPFGEYPEYHTSADDLDFVHADALEDSFNKCSSALDVVENDGFYVNQNPFCEPQLGRRGLYQSDGGESHKRLEQMALLWVLNLSDGAHSLLDIAERSGYDFELVSAAAMRLKQSGLLRQFSNPSQ